MKIIFVSIIILLSANQFGCSGPRSDPRFHQPPTRRILNGHHTHTDGTRHYHAHIK